MAMSKNGINTTGVIAIAAILGGVYFGVASPILTQKQEKISAIEQAKVVGQNYTKKLNNFSNGVDDSAKDATDTASLFNSLVSESLDIETASRAIAAALPEGVKLDSFNFGSPQQVSSLKSADMKITGYTAPEEFSAIAADGEGVDPSASVSGFQRIPFTIKVSAGSYEQLAEYLNSLAEQPRLMSVVSIETSRSGSVSASIYAFAFSGR